MCGPLEPKGMVPAGSWAVTELGNAQFGDLRLTYRLVSIAMALASRPDCSIPQACGSAAATKGAYRFFSSEDVAPESIIASHRDAALGRMGQLPVVLAVQDTTQFNFSSKPATKDLGRMSHPKELGFFVHSCLAVSPDGVPLGLLGHKLWTRPCDSLPGTGDRHGRSATAGKESARWEEMLRSSTRGLPEGTKVVTVADREADIYELFVAADELQQDLLIRASYDRRVDGDHGHLWKTAEQAQVLGFREIVVPRKDHKPSRKAQLELRVASVTLLPPDYRPPKPLPPLTLTALLARETKPPAGEEPLCWLLLTTLPITSQADALTCLQWYAHRWKIEMYHYTLKSGCRIEELQLEALDRLHRALAVYAVVAWRLLYLTYMARTEPEQPCTQVLSAAEWQALWCTIHRRKQPPENPPNLHTAVLWIARLGGFLGRKGDGNPGVKVLWQGYRRLQDLAAMWEIFRSN